MVPPLVLSRRSIRFSNVAFVGRRQAVSRLLRWIIEASSLGAFRHRPVGWASEHRRYLARLVPACVWMDAGTSHARGRCQRCSTTTRAIPDWCKSTGGSVHVPPRVSHEPKPERALRGRGGWSVVTVGYAR